MRTIRTAMYVTKLSNVFERLKNLEGRPDADGVAPLTPRQLSDQFGGEPQNTLNQPAPAQEVQPWTPADMAQSFGGEPENGFTETEGEEFTPLMPANLTDPKEIARFLFKYYKKESSRVANDPAYRAEVLLTIAGAYTDSLQDTVVGIWFARLVAQELGQQENGQLFIDPAAEQTFEAIKSIVPENVQDALTQLFGDGF